MRARYERNRWLIPSQEKISTSTVISVVSSTRNRLRPSTPTRYSMLNCGTQGAASTNCMPASPLRQPTHSRHDTANVARPISSAHHFWSRSPGRISSTSAPTSGRKMMIESNGMFDGFIKAHSVPVIHHGVVASLCWNSSSVINPVARVSTKSLIRSAALRFSAATFVSPELRARTRHNITLYNAFTSLRKRSRRSTNRSASASVWRAAVSSIVTSSA